MIPDKISLLVPAEADTKRSLSRRSLLGKSAAAVLAGALGVGSHAVFAQEGSAGTARIVVPFAPGAAVDAVARMLATTLAAQWGKSVIVENRPGARTFLAAEMVARSEPDGNTLLFCLDDTFTIVPQLTKDKRFDPNKELVPVNLVGTIPLVVVVNPNLKVNSLPELIDYARANPTALNYSSSGVGSAPHLAMEMLKAQAKIQIQHVPYRGLAPALTAVMTGEVQIAIVGYGSSRGVIEGGKVRVISVASPDRIPALPNIPTNAELGYPRVDATSRLTLAVPAKMAPAAVEQLNESVSRALSNVELRKQIESRDIMVTNMGPKPFAAEIARLSGWNAEAIKISGAESE
jgi:tripartite-type tricarboxylate transporter receptor subunit TctC